jgi:tetratricopeptide (TPR) repeat protein
MRRVHAVRLGWALAVLLAGPGAAWSRADERPRVRAKGRNYAFLVACAKYRKTELKTLKYTRADILDFSRVLSESGFGKENLVILHDGRGQEPEDLPLAENIRSRLRQLLAEVRAQDTLVVALAGHGVQFAGEKAAYFCPIDAKLTDRKTLIGLDELYADLKNCKAARKLLLVDACRDAPQSDLGRGRVQVSLEKLAGVQKVPLPRGVVALFSCSAGQQSFEDPRLEHGVFFHHLMKGWKGFAADQQGRVTFSSLADYVTEEVPRYVRLTMRLTDPQVPEQKNEFAGLWVLHDTGISRRALRAQALGLNGLTRDEDADAAFHRLLKEMVRARRLVAVATEMAQGDGQRFDFYAALILARLAEKSKELDTAHRFWRLCIDQAKELKSGQKLNQAYVNLIDMYYDSRQYEASARVCKEFLVLLEAVIKNSRTGARRLFLCPNCGKFHVGVVKDYKTAVRRMMIQAIAKQGKLDEAARLVDNLIKVRPRDWLNLQLKGWVLREAGKYSEAARVYEQVLQQIKRDRELKADERELNLEKYRYALSTIYTDLNQVDKASAALKELLARKPDDPTYNNDLGYIWADHDMNLPEAEKLIRKALDEDRKLRKKENLKPEEDRDSGVYLDSLGWVLFKQKKYKEARETLLKAVEDKESQYIEIYDHLGDVHWALGEKDQAVQAWKKGLKSLSTPSKRDQEREAAIKEKLQKANQTSALRTEA